MTEVVELRVPNEPACWSTCGTCQSPTLTVIEILAAPEQRVGLYQPLLLLEAYKTELEVVSPTAGMLTELLVELDDEVAPGELVARLLSD